MKGTKTIAVVHRLENVRQGLVQAVASKFPGFTLEPVAKLNDAPAGNAGIVHRGLPSFVPPNQVTRVYAVNTKYYEDAAAREASNAILASADSTPEQIAGELSNINEFIILPAGACDKAKGEITEARMNLMEHEMEGRPVIEDGNAESAAAAEKWDTEHKRLSKAYVDALKSHPALSV